VVPLMPAGAMRLRSNPTDRLDQALSDGLSISSQRCAYTIAAMWPVPGRVRCCAARTGSARNPRYRHRFALSSHRFDGAKDVVRYAPEVCCERRRMTGIGRNETRVLADLRRSENGRGSVESRCGAVAVGAAYLCPPLSAGGASLA
jgi:hypothetical protein